MPDAISEALEFDISAALTGIQAVSDALTQAVTDFGVGLSQALETLTSVGASVTPLTETLDVAGLGPAIDTAIVDATSQPQTVTIDGDPAGLTASIDEATAVSPVVAVQADTAEAAGSIDALSGTPVEVDVTANTDEAQANLDAVGASATRAVGGGNQGVAGLEGAVLGFKAASGVAQGETAGLTGAIGGLSKGFETAIGGGVAFTAFLGETVRLAADAQAQQNRFNAVFGQSAAIVKNINVGGLTTDLASLGRQSGTTTADLESSASRIGALGAASKASQPEVAKTASDLLGLAAALSVANPRLGDTATVADTISRALATGRTRSLIPYGISVSQVAIQQKALADNIGSTSATLTGYEKLTAGLTLALEQQGNTLGTKYADGVKGAQIQLRALKTQLEEALVAIGTPLLEPVTASLRELLPVAISVGTVLGQVAQIVVPLLTTLGPPLEAVASGLGFVADGVAAIGDVIGAIPGPTVALAIGLGALTIAFDTGATAATIFGAAVDFALGPVGLVIGALTVLGGIGALGGIGGKAKEAAIDTGVLSNAFSVVAGNGDSFVGTIEQVNNALDKFLAKNLAVGDVGSQPVDALNTMGISLGALKNALTGTDKAFSDFQFGLLSSPTKTDETSKSFLALDDVLVQARTSLEVGAHATLQQAIQTGLLTQANVGSAAAWRDLKFETGGSISTLERFQPLLDAATAAANRNAAALSTTSPQYAELIRQFSTGAITIDTLTTSLARFGFAGTAPADEAKKISQALDSLTKAAEGALPTVGGAIDAFASKVKTDFTQVAKDIHDGTGNVKADLKTLADDQDPQRFTDNLHQQTANILSFTANLRTLVAGGFGTLAASLATKGPEVAGALAASLASSPAKALAAQGAEVLSANAVTSLDTFLRAHFPELDGLGVDAGGHIITGVGTGITNGLPAVGDTATSAARAVSDRFDPSFSHRVDVAMQAAAVALGADTSVSEKAGQAGLQAVAAFEATFGPVTTAQAARIALAGAHDALTTDQTLPTASGGAGDKTAAGFKPNLKSGAQAGIASGAAAFGDLTQIGKLTTAAGTLGHSVGVGFDAGVAEGLREPKSVADVTAAASELAHAIPAPLRKLLGITSPSKVGITIGQQFVEGITLGLGDTTGIANAGANLAVTVSSSAALASLGASVTSSVVAGFNDPATVDAAVKTLQGLVAKAAQSAAATAAATAAQSFAQGIVSGLPNAGTAISTFSQQVTQAASTQTAAFNAVHAAYQKYADDLRHKAPTATLGADLQTIATTAKDLGTAQQALAVASNPAEFVKNLRAQTAANEAFQRNLRTLISRGDVDLARQLEQAGPAAAGKLAASLASKPALAKAAEAAVDQANAFSKSYQTFLEKQFAPQVHALASKIGTQTGQALNAGISVNGVPIAQSVSVAGPSSKTDAQAAALNAAGASQTLNLDLAIELPDGTILNSKQTVKVPMTAQEITRIKSRTKAAVIA